MSNRISPELLASLRTRAGELTTQTLSLRGRAAAAAAGGATMGVLALGSAVGAMASTAPVPEVQTVAGVAGVAGAGKGGTAAQPGQLAGSLGESAIKAARPGGSGGSDESENDEDSGENEKSIGTVAAKAGDAQRKTGAAGSAGNGAEDAEEGGNGEDAESASADDVIELARKQVGISEGSGGATKFHDWYIGNKAAKLTAARDGGSPSSYKGAAWCDMFVSWLGEKTGVKGMGADAYTVSHAKWFKKTGRWGQEPKPGAVVFFAWDGGGIPAIEHVGVVVKDNGDGTVKTIEGNTEDAVKEKTRSESQIAGYGYPDYDND